MNNFHELKTKRQVIKGHKGTKEDGQVPTTTSTRLVFANSTKIVLAFFELHQTISSSIKFDGIFILILKEMKIHHSIVTVTVEFLLYSSQFQIFNFLKCHCLSLTFLFITLVSHLQTCFKTWITWEAWLAAVQM